MRLLFSLLLLFVFSTARGQEKIPNAVTLLNAIDYGLKNNRAIINANRDVQKAYKEAVDKKYRFYSYGDAMLIL